jgi:hypothetical protein
VLPGDAVRSGPLPIRAAHLPFSDPEVELPVLGRRAGRARRRRLGVRERRRSEGERSDGERGEDAAHEGER